MSGQDPCIYLEDLYKSYIPPLSMGRLLTFRWGRRPVEALKGITISFAPSKVHGLVGPNGAGKTTLLQLISGLLLPTKGKVLVHGLDTRRARRRVAQIVGYCISDPRSFFLRLSGRENLLFFAALYGLDKKSRLMRVEELLQAFELEEVSNRQVLSYSEGMKQRLAIARALIHRPKVLLLDEVSRGLDPRLRDKTFQMIQRDLVEGLGTTVLMASHNISEIEALAHKVYVLEKGQIVASGRYEEVKEEIERVFGRPQ